MAYKPKFLTPAEGGLGAATTATSGKILQGDGTNWVASTPTFPTTAGTSGKILISNGTNFVSSTPTYPNAAGTANNVLASDGTNFVSTKPAFVFLASNTISGAPATVAFTSGLTAYSTLMVEIASVQPANNGVTFDIDVSNDGGSTYFATSWASGVNYSATNSATVTNANSSTTGLIANAVNNASLVNATLWVYQIGLTGSFYYHGTSTWYNGSNIVFGLFGGSNTNNSINALRFGFSAGNMNNTGYIAIYGLVK
jgi:hypothetical protein